MSITARDFKLQFTAVSSLGNRESPVQIKLADGITVLEIGQVTWDSETETVYVNEYVAPPIPEPEPEV